MKYANTGYLETKQSNLIHMEKQQSTSTLIPFNANKQNEMCAAQTKGKHLLRGRS